MGTGSEPPGEAPGTGADCSRSTWDAKTILGSGVEGTTLCDFLHRCHPFVFQNIIVMGESAVGPGGRCARAPGSADHRRFPSNLAFLLINAARTLLVFFPFPIVKCSCKAKELLGPHRCQWLVVLGLKKKKNNKKKSNSTGREEYYFQESSRAEIPISCVLALASHSFGCLLREKGAP